MARRRRNPIRTTGALIINPRRRNRRRRTNTKRRRNSLRIRTNKRRNATRRRNSLRIRTNRRRRNSLRIRTNRARKRSPRVAARYNRRRRSTRKGQYRRTSRRAYTRNRRRRNPRRRRNQTMQAQLKKLPLVGGILASMAGFLPFGVFGAIGVEPTVWIAGLAARWFPMVPASAVYIISGAIAASIIDMLPFGKPALREKLAIATMSAAGGVAYYKWRTGQDTEIAVEMAGIHQLGYSSPFGALGQAFGNGGPTAVYPLGHPAYAGHYQG